jgi:hypothetical protein
MSLNAEPGDVIVTPAGTSRDWESATSFNEESDERA